MCKRVNITKTAFSGGFIIPIDLNDALFYPDHTSQLALNYQL